MLAQGELPLLAHQLARWHAHDAAALADANDEFVASRESFELRRETEQMGWSLAQLCASLEWGDAARRATLASIPSVALPSAFAIAAAAATLTWIVVPQMQGVGAPGAVQVASVSPVQQGPLQRVAAAQTGAQDVNIIRDASLDQYLEAHQQFAQQPVVTGSMPVIRTAVTTQGQ